LPPKQQLLANEPPRFSMAAFCFTCNASLFFEIAFVVVRLDHVASIGSGGYLHPNFRLWACLLLVLR
jgi:hypothetical protein